MPTQQAVSLGLSVADTPFVAGQSIPLRLRLSSSSSALEFPLDLDSCGCVTIRVCTPDGTTVFEGNGTAKARRLGVDAQPVDAAYSDIGELPAGETFEWIEDVCDYVDLPGPGTYHVSAAFRFAESGIDCTSDTCPVAVVPQVPAWADAISDFGRSMLVYSCVQHEHDGDVRALYASAFAARPAASIVRGTLEVAPDAQPLIAITDYPVATYQQETLRWVGWVSGNAVHLCSVSRDGAGHTTASARFDSEAVQLIGRPIQHADDGVSVYVVAGSKDGTGRILRQHFGADGAPGSLTTIAEVAAGGQQGVCTADAAGVHYLCYARDERLPIETLRIVGDTVSSTSLAPDSLPLSMQEMQAAGDMRVLGMRADAKLFGKPLLWAPIATVSQSTGLPMLLLLRCDLMEPRSAGVQRVAIEFLDDDETIASAESAETWAVPPDSAQRSTQVALLTTTRGRVFLLPESGHPRFVSRHDPRVVARPRVLTGADGAIYAFVPSGPGGMIWRKAYPL